MMSTKGSSSKMPPESQNIKREWNNEEEADDRNLIAVEHRFRKLATNGIVVGIEDDKDETQDDEEKVGEIEDQINAEVRPDLVNVIDLTEDDPLEDEKIAQILVRNAPISLPDEQLDTYDLNGQLLKPQSAVQIHRRDQDNLYRTSFLWIQHILETQNGTKLRGIPLTRLRNLRGRLPRLRNEVAMVLNVDQDDDREHRVQAAIEVSIEDVITTRTCHFTNAKFPEHRCPVGIFRTIEEIEAKGVLMCRWQCIFVYKDASTRMKNGPPMEFVIQHLVADEASRNRFRVSETQRLNDWRGGKVRGGEHNSGEKGIQGQIIELDEKNEESDFTPIPKKAGQQYTFGDMFSGAGGTSCGARKAGFHINVACDNHPGAQKTYSRVYPEAKLYGIDIFDFIANDQTAHRVDVLHMSPPCQYWSPAHTVEGKNDEANIAVLFSCHELVKKLRPRLFTLEQTFGIMHPRFEFYFNALVHGFTQYNYSMRWKVCDLVVWGLPARRQRLIMIGSCPGEELPPFPEATHVPYKNRRPGKKPFYTVRKALFKIPKDQKNWDELHQPTTMIRRDFTRWSANQTLQRVITASNGGVGNYHPSGRRDFTRREFATLQTFPVNYPFEAPHQLRQIGNAFPPLVVKTLYTHLRNWLEERDGIIDTSNVPDPIDADELDVVIVPEDDEYTSDFVEYTGTRRRQESIDDSSSGDEMDVDSDSPVVSACVDVNQERVVWDPIDLTRGSVSDAGGGDYIDLTSE
ncbi:S-adenosyl-L-methionine-dependent methyltransferase [Xylariaceae sp. FL1272]|nr:S-adenosyl-L-methionine-dependent methyltransferase [Xylariaceae sp. FL1272]